VVIRPFNRVGPMTIDIERRFSIIFGTSNCICGTATYFIFRSSRTSYGIPAAICQCFGKACKGKDAMVGKYQILPKLTFASWILTRTARRARGYFIIRAHR